MDNTIQYGEDADVRTHDFEPAEDGFDADRLLGEGGWGFCGTYDIFSSPNQSLAGKNSCRDLPVFTEGYYDMPEALPGIMERDKDKVVD